MLVNIQEKQQNASAEQTQFTNIKNMENQNESIEIKNKSEKKSPLDLSFTVDNANKSESLLYCFQKTVKNIEEPIIKNVHRIIEPKKTENSNSKKPINITLSILYRNYINYI